MLQIGSRIAANEGGERKEVLNQRVTRIGPREILKRGSAAINIFGHGKQPSLVHAERHRPCIVHSGMIMLLLCRLPSTTDRVDWDGWRFEVVDMDGKRIDKVLVAPIPATTD